MIQILKALLPGFSPAKILIDFEKSCKKAAEEAFLLAEVKGCYFHLCQSLQRKVKEVGLKSEFDSDPETKIRIKSLAALALVPSHDVENIFRNLVLTFPDDERYDIILSYFQTTYIIGAGGRRAVFPIDFWNHFEAAKEGSPKTTNCCEGFHNALNSIFNCSHPSVWFLLEGLKKDIACHRLTLGNLRSGRPEVVKKRYAEIASRLSLLVERYECETNKIRYLRNIVNLQ